MRCGIREAFCGQAWLGPNDAASRNFMGAGREQEEFDAAPLPQRFRQGVQKPCGFLTSYKPRTSMSRRLAISDLARPRTVRTRT